MMDISTWDEMMNRSVKSEDVINAEYQHQISSNGQSKPCSNYNENSGCCKSSGKLCDTCYDNSLNVSL